MLHFSLLGAANDAVIVFLMENFLVGRDEGSEELHSFFLTFKHEDSGCGSAGDKRHCFVADSARSVTQWIEVRESWQQRELF